MIKVVVFGTFDLIHPGHIHLLKQAKEYGDFLVVVIARDKISCDVKGRLPKNNERTRLKNIKKTGIANKVRLGCLDDRYQVIREEKPNVIALGYDQKAFIDKLEDVVDDNTKIVRLAPYKPEIYKSSKLAT